MNDAEATPAGLQPVVDEVDLALREVAARLSEIAAALRAGQVRFRGMQGAERSAFVRNAAARLRDVERFSHFAAVLFEEEFVAPLAMKYETPQNLVAIRPRTRWATTVKLLAALATLAGAVAGLWRAVRGEKP